jgi:hypothetical protein
MGVVVVEEDAEDMFEVTAVHDQEPVEALGADGADEALGDRVRLRRSNWCLDDLDAFACEDRVEVAGNLLSGSRIRKRNDDPRSWSVQANWRACWVTQSPVGSL